MDGATCFHQKYEYWQCIPSCDDTSPSSCCNPQTKSCSTCLAQEGSVVVKQQEKFYISAGVEFLRVTITQRTGGCCYPGGDGKLYYDDGSACNKAVCTFNGGVWKSIHEIGPASSDPVCISKRSSAKVDMDGHVDVTGDVPGGQKVRTNTLILLDGIATQEDAEKSVMQINTKSYAYYLLSVKPKDWPTAAPSMPPTFNRSKCDANTGILFKDTFRRNHRCEDVKSDFSEKQIPASTTNFAFGSATSCMCNGKQLMDELKDQTTDGHAWVGVATPSWMQSPFNTTVAGGTALGGSTVEWRFGETFTSNCSMGPGGCGTCWQLEAVADADGNMYNDDEKRVVNAVVIDTCEDANAYGNNYNWCVATRPDVEAQAYDPGQTYDGHFPPFFGAMPSASTNVARSGDGFMHWKADDCFEGDNFICRNAAGLPAHFDVAVQTFDEETRKKIGWNLENPMVLATHITCPPKITSVLTQNCGANANITGADPQYWCPGMDPEKMTYWP